MFIFFCLYYPPPPPYCNVLYDTTITKKIKVEKIINKGEEGASRVAPGAQLSGQLSRVIFYFLFMYSVLVVKMNNLKINRISLAFRCLRMVPR